MLTVQFKRVSSNVELVRKTWSVRDKKGKVTTQTKNLYNHDKIKYLCKSVYVLLLLLRPLCNLKSLNVGKSVTPRETNRGGSCT